MQWDLTASRVNCDDAVTVNELEALFELFKKLSSSIIDDGSIHKVCQIIVFASYK